MTYQIHEKHFAPHVSVLGMLMGCLAFWAVLATLVLNW